MQHGLLQEPDMGFIRFLVEEAEPCFPYYEVQAVARPCLRLVVSAEKPKLGTPSAQSLERLSDR